MPVEPARLRWPSSVLEPTQAAKVLDDDERRLRHMLMVSYRDLLNFDVVNTGGITVANNITNERVPCAPHGLIVEIKAHSKAPGAGNITLRVNNDGNVVGSITIPGGSSSVVKAYPTTYLQTLDTSRISVDCTAVSGTWEIILLSVVIDPVQE